MREECREIFTSGFHTKRAGAKYLTYPPINVQSKQRGESPILCQRRAELATGIANTVLFTA